MLKKQYGSHVAGHNGAMAGALSAYMSACHNVHVPKSADIIFVEYSVNDQAVALPVFDNAMRRPYERLLRKLLKYPNRPAVVLVHTYVHSMATPLPGVFYNSAEREMQEFALYYGLPSISVKAAVFPLMVANVPGFMPSPPRLTDEKGLKLKAFYFDAVHPDGNTGCRVIAELVYHLILHTAADISSRPVDGDDTAVAAASLAPPMVPDNHESASDKCFIGMQFTGRVTAKQGFEWINESKTPRPKFGMVATEPGSRLEISVDTTAGGPTAKAGAMVVVELAHLKSYENMGKASVACEGGCTCQSTTLDGHTTLRNSQLHLHQFHVSQAADCKIVITVLAETSSGKNKVKLAGITISEEPGDTAGMRNDQALNYAHDISMRGEDGVFEVMNHA
ncbi:hypothetical protein QJQ45_012903 [Haematococcus lacustris]|nr:hypothetical protein QJQ45_012903 [Haematococcus lacustris]